MNYPAKWSTENGYAVSVERPFFESFFSKYTFDVIDSNGEKHCFQLTENNDFPTKGLIRRLRPGRFDLYSDGGEWFDKSEIEAYIEWGLKTNYLSLSPLSNSAKRIYLMGECRLIYKCCLHAPFANTLNIKNSDGRIALQYIEQEHEHFWSYQNSLTVFS